MSSGNDNDASTNDFPWELGVFDAHCHPVENMACLEEVPKMRARALTIMATRLQDQELVLQANERLGLSSADLAPQSETEKVLPAMGLHPWFSFQLYDDRTSPDAAAPTKLDHYQHVLTPSPEDLNFLDGFPDPQSLSAYLEQSRTALRNHPLAMVGEIGIDRSFRIPDMTAEVRKVQPGRTEGARQGRKLSAHRVTMQHQQAVLTAQLNLAGEMGRAVSVHGVAAHGLLYETIRATWKGYEVKNASKRSRKRRKSADNAHAQDDSGDGEDAAAAAQKPKPFPPRICLHSYSGPPEPLKQYLHPSVPATIYFSFSMAVNFSFPASGKAVEVIKALPEDRILVESDIHRAGPPMDQALEDVVRQICEIRGWELGSGVKLLGDNWKRFAFG